MTTNVPRVTFGPSGFQAPSQEAILVGRQQDIDQAFGGGLDPSLETPQGQLASSDASIIGDADDAFLFMTNMFDPAYAFGRYQDALARIYFLERDPSEPTIVQATCTRLAGTVILAGAIAIAEDNSLFVSTLDGTITDTGGVVIPFAAQLAGPTPCPAGSLSRIYQAIPGWDAIDNLADGVIGKDTESREAFEARRAASVAINSVGVLGAIRGNVLAVAAVLDAYVTENDTNAPVTKGGFLLAANSLYVAAVGGDQDAVARAIWTKKNPGCSYNGNTTVVVFDDQSGYNPPFPSYSVSFEIPNPIQVLFAVSIVNGPLVPADAVTQIQSAIIAAFSGSDGGSRATIGSTILASRFYGPLALLGWAQVISLLVGSNNTPIVLFTGSIATTVLTVSAVASGVLAIGQTIGDHTEEVLPGTIITAQITGSAGGTGTYRVGVAQTVVSEAMTASKATLNSVVVQIDQVPTISANNILVTLV